MPGTVLPIDRLRERLAQFRAEGRSVVLTNGVFDLLHVGHLRYLREARALGGALVVGVNSDASVRGLKPGRPIVSEDERAELLAALEPVDAVVIFDSPTADDLIREVRPDVYVKGGDYSEETLPEAQSAREAGSQLAFIPLVPGKSTSALLAELRRSST